MLKLNKLKWRWDGLKRRGRSGCLRRWGFGGTNCAERDVFWFSRATSTVFRGGLVRLEQRLRDSSDSCRSCSIIIIMNSKRCSNLKYKSRSFSSGSTHFFFLFNRTYIRECMHAMYVACMQCMYVCVCICVCVYISVIYIVSIYRHVCIYQLCSLSLPSYMYVYINYEVSVYRHVYVYQCSI